MNTLPGSNPPQSSPTAEPQPAPAHLPCRFGSVPYLNARPLHWTIREPVAFLEPSQLSLALAEGRYQAGLVSVAEVLESSDLYHIVSGVAIGSLNSIYSVVLVHNLPVIRVKTVALDPASKSSNQLLRVLLQKYYRLNPRYVSPDEPAEAHVIIGDPAIAYRQTHPDERYLDLAQSWHVFTGLPSVFAVWAVRRDAPDPEGLAQTLRAAAKTGLAVRDEIAHNHFEYHYLTEHLYYQLGDPQKKAIAAFATDLLEIGQLAKPPQLSYI
ncbi:MAG: menaquinone biosynthesis protein [Methylacidiphilales bacterium]|nr:menaquinone biosynthesis protein [Candidatus Methylacidiphilales bacterium]